MFVLGLAFALVFVIARLLTAGSDGRSGEQPAAEQAGGRVEVTGTVTAGEDAAAAETGGSEPADPVGAADPGGTEPATVPTTPTLAEPQGECTPSDVLVTPSIAEGAVAGRDVPVTLSLQTRKSEACTWQVAGDSVVVKVSQGGKDVWTTRQCPKAVPAQPVVVRQAVATVVQLTWPEARESTDGCTRNAGWAKPGKFTIAAAALGGEPAEAQFALGAPAPETIQVTLKEKRTKKAKKPKTPTN
ncbi:hypothetical protein GCM10009788_04580 [Nocardioides humi]|uniref:DUF4232 domain-containing protein n=1 Tax=Nocardioides humi TaxID=449461 RepID=A0ABN1ZTY5_9ACTN